MKIRTLRFGLLTVGVLLVAGCKFHATTAVNPDGAGELRTEVGFTAEERQNMESQPGNTGSQNFCQPPSPDATTTEEQRGDETWCLTTQKFGNPDELRRLYETRKGIKINRLEIASGKFYYDIEVDTSSTTSDFTNFSEITWVVVMPDALTDHNAMQIEGNTLTWNLTPKSGPAHLRAESAARGANTLLLIGVGLLCLIGFLSGNFFLLRRSPLTRRNEKS